MLLLSEQNVKECLLMRDCLEVNRKALKSVANGDAQVPTRLGLQYLPPSSPVSSAGTETKEEAADWTLFKPAALTHPQEGKEPYDRCTQNMGMKLVSIRSNNPSKGLPLVPATILSVDAETGQIRSVVAATYLTAARTAAGSALSTVLVKDVRDIVHVTVFGAGLQAKLHIHALATAMGTHIPHLTIVNRTTSSAQRLQSEIPSEWALTVHVVSLSDTDAVAQTLSQSNVVITATNTTTPLFDGNLLKPGTHLCGVGSYTPDMQELSIAAVNRCRVLMDTPDARTVGDLKHLTMSHPVTLVGQALMDAEKHDGTLDRPAFVQACFPRESDTSSVDCTLFKSVGTAIQDILTADLVVQKAMERAIGTEVDMA